MRVVSLAAAAFVISLISSAALVYAAPAPAAASNSTTTICLPTPNPFTVTKTAWGSPTSSLGVFPGDEDAPLTVTLLYAGPCTATEVGFILSLTSPFAGVDGNSKPAAYEVNMSPDTLVSETFYLNVAANASLSTYTIPLNIKYNTSSYYGIFSQSTNAVITLRGSTQLSFSASSAALEAGSLNNITILITNSGSGTATSVSPTVVAPSQVSILNQLSAVPSLSPGSSVAQTLRIYLPTSSVGSAISLAFSAGYRDSYSISRTVTQTLGFYVSTIHPQLPSLISVDQVNDSVVAGAQSSILFTLLNTGTSTLYAPTFSLTVSSPLVLLGSSLSTPGFILGGQVGRLVAILSSSPTATPGVYGGNLAVTFTDQNGNLHTQSFSIGFVLTGTIKLVVQNEQITQSSSGITVSGSLLNEGSAAAYYAEVNGFLKGSSAPNATAYYVGEIDPNTPTPFTVTIAYPAPNRPQGSATISLTVSYKDSFGSEKTYATSRVSALQSAAQLLQSQATTGGAEATVDQGLINLVTYGIITTIVLVSLAGVVVVRRRRRPKEPSRQGEVI